MQIMKKLIIAAFAVLMVFSFSSFTSFALAETANDDSANDDSANDDSNDDSDDDTADVIVDIENPLTSNTFDEIVGNLIDFVFTIALIICPLIIVFGGYTFITAGGDPKKVENGKKIIYFALIGLGIVLLAKGFIMALKQILGVKEEALLIIRKFI